MVFEFRDISVFDSIFEIFLFFQENIKIFENLLEHFKYIFSKFILYLLGFHAIILNFSGFSNRLESLKPSDTDKKSIVLRISQSIWEFLNQKIDCIENFSIQNKKFFFKNIILLIDMFHINFKFLYGIFIFISPLKRYSS